MSKLLKRNAIIIIFFVFCTILFTYPLTFRMNSVIPGSATTDETLAVISYLWTVKYCTLNKLDLRHCDFLAYPFGVNFKNNTGSNYLWEFIKNKLNFLTNEVFTFNFLVFLSFVLSGWFTFLLVYYILRSNLVALFSGVIFAFSPYHFARAWQHLSLSQTQWMPLCLLSLFLLKDRPGRLSFTFIVIAFLFLASFNFYYAYFIIIATLTFIFWYFLNRTHNFKTKTRFALLLFLASIVVLVLISPSLLEIYREKLRMDSNIPLSHNIIRRPFEDLFSQSARPLSYFLPAPAHPVFGGFVQSFLGSNVYGESLTEHSLYLGWVPLILVFVAAKRWSKRRRPSAIRCQPSDNKENFYIGFFVLLAIVAWLFSQPPWWKIGSVKIYMPSFFMYKILPMFRAYCRFGILVMLSVAVLAGFGMELVLERFKTQKTKIAIICLATALILFEFWNWPPYKVIDVSKAPGVYCWLKEQPGDFAIAEYPLDAATANEKYLFYQTKHNKKIVNGTIPGTYANNVAHTIIRLSEPQTAEALKWMGVRYVLVHREDYLKTDLTQEQEELNKIPYNLGLKLVNSFPSQECPTEDIMCMQKTGPIDVYEVIAQPVKPEVIK